MHAVTLSTNRSYYDALHATKHTMTVRELIERLSLEDPDMKIIFSNDNGYTYGTISEDDVEDKYIPELRKFKAVGIEYELDDPEDEKEVEDAKSLPTEMVVECYDKCEVVDEVSDKTGWLIKSIASIIPIEG